MTALVRIHMGIKEADGEEKKNILEKIEEYSCGLRNGKAAISGTGSPKELKKKKKENEIKNKNP